MLKMHPLCVSIKRAKHRKEVWRVHGMHVLSTAKNRQRCTVASWSGSSFPIAVARRVVHDSLAPETGTGDRNQAI